MTVQNEIKFNRLLIPVKKVTFQKGFFRFPACPVFSSQYNADTSPLKQLAEDLSLYGLAVHTINKMTAQSTIKIYRDSGIKNPEAYRLNVVTDGTEIFAGSDAGAYYALQTLRELLKIYGNKLPLCRIADEPDFQRRGVYCDCSRGKVPKLSTLKELVTRLSQWKINELQLYIENVFTFKKHPEIGKGYSPFTADEILSLQDHCRKHHVRLVGSLASFGHLEKVLALPQYQHLGEMPGFRNYPGGTTLCPVDSGSIKLIGHLYDEFMPLFEAEDFNVCCDETWELGKGRSKQIADRIGTGRLYLEFLMKIYKLCQKHGKRMNVWADIVLKYPQLLKDLPKDVVLLNWEYEQNGVNIARTKEIAAAEMKFMVCPGTSSWLTHGSRLPNSMANVVNFADQGRKYGAEGLLNTDWGDNGHRNFLGVSMHSFAHGAACSWNGKAVDNKKFTQNFCFHFFGQASNELARRIETLGNNYFTCGTNVPNKSWLYFAMVEPMQIEHGAQSPSNLMKAAGLRKIVERYLNRSNWPKLPQSAKIFEQTALEELKLAEQMDYLASRRALVIKSLHAGSSVKKAELRYLSKEIEEMAEVFKRLWLSRNKMSRLRDNLSLFKQAGQW
jgi:hexosaminidase